MRWRSREPQATAAPAREPALAPGRSRAEAWLAELLAQRGARLAALVCWSLVALGLYAPFLAGGAPLYLQAVDQRGYSSALRALPLVAGNLERSLAQAGSVLGAEAAARAELEAFELRCRILAHYAPQECGALLAELEQGRRVALGHLRARDWNAAQSAARELAALCRRRQTDLAAKDPRLPRSQGLALRARASTPALASISFLEWWAMLAWPCVLLWGCLIAQLEGLPRGGGADALARSPGRILVACALVAALVQWMLPGAAPGAPADYKSALASGELLAGPVRFPPLPFSYFEQNLSEPLRPPTLLGPAGADERDAGRESAPPAGGLSGRLDGAVPVEVRFGELSSQASLRHPLGTDGLGRDLLARMIWGTRASLGSALLAAACMTTLGFVLGGLAGWLGGKPDLWITRVIELLMGVPTLFVVVLFAALCPPQVLPPLLAIVVIVTVLGWTGVARLVRARLLAERRRVHVEALRALGASELRLFCLHALPSALPPALVAGAFAVGSAILVESSASYLGFGISEPLPSWGALVQGTRNAEQWWLFLFPGLGIWVSVVSVYALAERAARVHGRQAAQTRTS
jgi:peptide/nickel transport system permease protein